MGYWGPDCQPCPRDAEDNVCGGHGICDGSGSTAGTGACACSPGYIGAACDQCDPAFWNPHCPTTTPGSPCSTHGNCDCGACDCVHGWDEEDCSVCAPGFDIASGCASCAAGFAGSGGRDESNRTATCSPCDACVNGYCDGNMTFGTGACVCDGGWSGASCDDAGSSAKTGTIVAGIAIGAGVMCFVVIALVAVAVVVAYYFVIVPRRKTGRLVTALNRGRDSIATRAPLLDPASQRSSVASRPQSAPARSAPASCASS